MLAILKSDAETLVAKRLAEHNAAAAGARIGPGGQELLAAGNTAGLLNGSVLKLKAESGRCCRWSTSEVRTPAG